jgi:hypothetical protein
MSVLQACVQNLEVERKTLGDNKGFCHSEACDSDCSGTMHSALTVPGHLIPRETELLHSSQSSDFLPSYVDIHIPVLKSVQDQQEIILHAFYGYLET